MTAIVRQLRRRLETRRSLALTRAFITDGQSGLNEFVAAAVFIGFIGAHAPRVLKSAHARTSCECP